MILLKEIYLEQQVLVVLKMIIKKIYLDFFFSLDISETYSSQKNNPDLEHWHFDLFFFSNYEGFNILSTEDRLKADEIFQKYDSVSEISPRLFVIVFQVRMLLKQNPTTKRESQKNDPERLQNQQNDQNGTFSTAQTMQPPSFNISCSKKLYKIIKTATKQGKQIEELNEDLFGRIKEYFMNHPSSIPQPEHSVSRHSNNIIKYISQLNHNDKKLKCWHQFLQGLERCSTIFGRLGQNHQNITSKKIRFMNQMDEKDLQSQAKQKLKDLQKLPYGYLTPPDICNFWGVVNNFPHCKHQCLQCINQYYENEYWPQTGQLYTLIGTRTSVEEVKEKCRWKFCAVLNMGGGYVFITDQQKQKIQGGDWLRGQIPAWELLINEVKESIFPKKFNYAVTQLNVNSRIPGQDTKRSIIRVTLTPISSMYTFFVMKKIDKFTPSFCCYFLDSKDKTKCKDTRAINHCGYFYNIITEKYAQNRQQLKKLAQGYPIKFTKGINTRCAKKISEQDQIKINRIISEQNQVKVLEEVIKIEETFKKVVDQEPKIAYKHQSLILLGSETDDPLINLIKQKLSSKKIKQYNLLKVYISYRSNSQKSIWFMSHECKLENIQPLINQILKEHKETKYKVLATITVTKYITFKKDPNSDEKLKQFHQAFRELFGKPSPEPLCQFVGEYSVKCNLYYKFETFQESVFAFIFLENMSIRSDYYKQTAYELKEKSLKNSNPNNQPQLSY